MYTDDNPCMDMHDMSCTHTQKVFIHKDAMSQQLDHVPSAGNAASRLHSCTKPNCRMSGCVHAWTCCSMLCTHGPCLYSLKHPVSSGKETLTAWPAANRMAHLCSSEDTR